MNEQDLRVVLVDDEEGLREQLAKHLRGEPYKYVVEAVPNSIEAQRLLEETQGRYDVALIDEVLKEGTGGLELLKHIKARYPDIEVILFTGWGMDSALEALQAGAYRYFAKPFNNEELALTIRFAAEHGQARREQKILSAFQQVSAAINSSLDINEIFRQTCKAAVSLFGVDHAGVVLFEADYSHGTVVAEYPETLNAGVARLVGIKLPIRGIPFEEQIAYAKEVVNIPDLATVSVLGETLEKLLTSGLQAMLIVPMINKDRVVGSLGLDVIHQPRTFSQNEIELCKSLANQAATAWENARLLHETARRAENMETLQRLLTTLASSLGLDQVLERTCQAATELFKVDHSGLVFFDDQFVQGRVEAEYPALGAVGTRVQLRGVPGVENFIATRKPLIVNDVADAESFGPVHDIWLGLGIRSIMVVPIISKGNLLGSFSLDAIQHPRQFTREEVELCETFAAQVAVAIGNARLFAAEARQRQKAETLREAALALTITLEPKEIFERILSELQKVVPYDSASIQLLKGDRLEIIDGRGFPNLSNLLGLSFPVNGDNPNREVLQRKAPFIVPDASAVYSDFLREPHVQSGIRGLLGVPMLVSDRLIGMIALDKKEPDFYTEEHARLALAFATQAAVVIENARLLQETQKRADQLEALRCTALAITSPLDRDALLRTIVKQAVDLLKARSGGVYAYYPERGELILIADHQRPKYLGRILKMGEGVAGRLVQSGESFV
ncbi:MAG: GAF domain-containing protein, partial [Chloroflexi bacterium]|nr:GAF domain-containing protein [Chloroflexota bacterium]